MFGQCFWAVMLDPAHHGGVFQRVALDSGIEVSLTQILHGAGVTPVICAEGGGMGAGPGLPGGMLSGPLDGGHAVSWWKFPSI